MVSGWFDSATTFKRCTAEKISFVFLSVFDLVLTILAMYLGLYEMNPLIRFLVHVPLMLLVVKLLIPVLIAWLMPGKLLLPSIALMTLVVIWNLKELAVFLL